MSRAYLLKPAQGSKPPFRSRTPAAGPGGFESFDIRPYWRDASCEEVGCEQWRLGWATVVDESTPLGQRQAAYIRSSSGRRFVEGRTEAGWTQFDFPAGQQCFDSGSHRIQAERPALYLRQGGDWRRRTSKARVYDRADQWVDDLHSRTEALSTARSRAGTADP